MSPPGERPEVSNHAPSMHGGHFVQAGNVFGDIVLGSTAPDVNDWTESLAQGVQALWRREEEHRRVHDPVALPVRWHPAAAELSDRWDNVHRTPAGTTAEPLALHGRIEDLAAVYRRVPSGRMVILGPAGSGKTVLAARLALDLLATRAPGDLVPVIVSAGSWNPATTPLHTWLADQLTRDHPGLAAAAGPGRQTRAGILLDAGRVLPILDGFDEINTGLHTAALQRLNTTPDLPVVITSRAAEYATAVHGADVLTAAAVVELDDLTLDDLAAYLPRTVAGHRTGTWDPLLDRLRTHPDDPASVVVRETLTNPLMVFLARTIYSDTPGHNPTDLLDTHHHHHHPTTETLQDHLLTAFIPAAYHPSHTHTPRWTADRAHHYLTYLANHLHKAGTRDLAWWQLRDTIPRWRRTLILATADALVLTLTTGLVYGLLRWLVFPVWASGPTNAVPEGLRFGLAAAAVTAMMNGLTVALMTIATAHLHTHSRGSSHFLTGGSGKTVVAAGIGLTTALAVLFLLMLLTKSGYPGESNFGSNVATACLLGFGATVIVRLVSQRAAGLEPNFTMIRIRGRIRFIINKMIIGSAVGYGFALLFIASFGPGFRAGPEFMVGFVLVGGFTFALTFGLEAPAGAAEVVSPAQSLARDRRNTLRKLVTISATGLVVAYAAVDTVESSWGPAAGSLVIAAVYLAARTTSAWVYWLVLVRGWLSLTGRLPWRVQTFLADAHRRGVLRQTGAVYQFRHARLQHQLTTHAPAAHD